MPNHNRVELIGNISIDPKTHTFPSGDLQVKFSLTTKEEWQDKRSGGMVKRTVFHNIVVDNQSAAKFAQGFVKKGDLVAVFGQLRNREYETDGAKQRITEVVVDRFSGKLIGLQADGGRAGLRSRSNGTFCRARLRDLRLRNLLCRYRPARTPLP